jgi:hypothetical protein
MLHQQCIGLIELHWDASWFMRVMLVHLKAIDGNGDSDD